MLNRRGAREIRGCLAHRQVVQPPVGDGQKVETGYQGDERICAIPFRSQKAECNDRKAKVDDLVDQICGDWQQAVFSNRARGVGVIVPVESTP